MEEVASNGEGTESDQRNGLEKIETPNNWSGGGGAIANSSVANSICSNEVRPYKLRKLGRSTSANLCSGNEGISVEGVSHSGSRECEKRRSVSIGEVFIKTHTEPNRSYLNLKAEAYEHNLEDKLSQTNVGTSRRQQLTVDDMNAIFLQSTTRDKRGRYYGLGSMRLAHSTDTGRGSSASTSSPAFISMQEQLQAQKIEEQNAKNARQDAKLQNLTANLESLVSYLQAKDPGLAAYMAKNASSAVDPTDPSSGNQSSSSKFRPSTLPFGSPPHN